jgi:S-adenosylmethionine:tRNA ribosyltransferase-isomerase
MLLPLDFDYPLPPNLIAHQPLEPRDHSRLMKLDRFASSISHHHFYDLPQLIDSNSVLVLNQTKVFPARLFGRKPTGGKVEVLLIRQLQQDSWLALIKPGLKLGQNIIFDSQLQAQVIFRDISKSETEIRFNQSGVDFWQTLDRLGHTPVPPYIHTTLSEKQLRQRYQTIYAKTTGSAAAPTAGFHFTPTIFEQLRQIGVQIEYITLHVGLGTFQPLQEENLLLGKLHPEVYQIDEDVALRLNQAKAQGKKIMAVGTTTVRTLESAAQAGSLGSNSILVPGSGVTQLFIHPPYQFKFVDHLITNFHLPQSSLLMLVTAFVSQPNTPAPFTTFPESLVGQGYTQAVSQNYRFFSFGDAMLIL